MNLVQRVQAPTPKFFRVMRSIGLTLTAASAVILASPIALPALVLTIAGYVAVGGAVATAVSQTAVNNEEEAESLQAVDERKKGSTGGGSTMDGSLDR